MKIPVVRPNKIPVFICSGLLALTLPVAALHAVDPPNADAEKFLVPYEQVLKALVDENLNDAKDAAHALPDHEGDKIQHADNLKTARESFAELSQTAEKLVQGQPGYHVFYCPMAKKDWVQQSTTVANPYMGKDMLTCGIEKK